MGFFTQPRGPEVFKTENFKPSSSTDHRIQGFSWPSSSSSHLDQIWQLKCFAVGQMWSACSTQNNIWPHRQYTQGGLGTKVSQSLIRKDHCKSRGDSGDQIWCRDTTSLIRVWLLDNDQSLTMIKDDQETQHQWWKLLKATLTASWFYHPHPWKET